MLIAMLLMGNQFFDAGDFLAAVVPAPAGLSADLAAFLSGDLLSDLVASPVSCTFFFLPDLKSVSYQPPPLRRNAAAVTIFFMAGLPHSGQSFRGSSEIFCSTSVWKPHSVHWYSYIGITVQHQNISSELYTPSLPAVMSMLSFAHVKTRWQDHPHYRQFERYRLLCCQGSATTRLPGICHRQASRKRSHAQC